MQELQKRCLSGAILLLVCFTLSAQIPTEEAILNRSSKTLSGKYIATVQVDDIKDLSKYISTHSDVQLMHYADGVAKIISDNDHRLSTISYFHKNLTTQSTTKTQPKFTSNLQSLLQKSSAKSRHELVITLYDVDASGLVADHLIDAGLAEVVGSFAKTIRILTSADALEQIARLAEVVEIDIIDEQVQKLNYESRIMQRNNVLYANAGVGGYELTGAGVTIGIGDGGELGNHIDFGQRVINQANGTYASFGAHGDHVAGIVGASGALNPRHKGVASGAQIITQKTTQIIANAEDYQDAYGMTLTNNSYGVSFNCETNGTYNYNSVNLDYVSRMNPKMLHVFAAGNNGTRSCEGYPDGFNTILRNYQASKNVITVGAVGDNREIANISARGPVADGRIKPEIVANGMNVISTGNDLNYFSNNGTSMAAPALTATLALLTEQYEKTYNEKPDGGLLKAIACNTADDLGNLGPDYTYGFGMVNARRAVETIIDGRHAQGMIQNGNNSIHLIDIPSGVKEVKIMLYWQDREGTHLAERTLVNDLDLRVIDANQVNHLPWILDTTPSQVAAPATKGVDELNNIEQISISNPTQGTMRVTVDGSKVPYDVQNYYLVYDFIKEDVVLTNPVGQEIFTPNKYQLISWDAEPNNTSKFKLSYSKDNGTSWITLLNDIPADQRSYAWNVPENMTEQAIIRVQKINGGSYDQSANFSVRQPISTFDVAPICEGMVAMNWGFENDASYPTSIIMIDDHDGVEINVSSTGEYIYEHPLSSGSPYWFSVDFADQGVNGSSRTIAQSIVPSYDLTCPWPDDIKLHAEPAVFTGRALTSRSTITVQLPITVKNLGDNTQEALELNYNLEGAQSTTIPQVLESGDTYNYNLIETLRNLEPGIQKVSISTPTDRTDNNNLQDIMTIITLPNEPVELPYVLNINTAEDQTYVNSEIGLDNIDRMDYVNDGAGQLSIAEHKGTRALVLKSVASEEQNQLLMTFNLNGLSVDEPVFLKMDYTHSGIGELITEIRGDDQSEWIRLSTPMESNEWMTTDSVSISELLSNSNQAYSTSTQIRFTQNGVGVFAMKNLILSADKEAVATTPYVSELNIVETNGDQQLVWSNNIEHTGYQFEIQYATDSIALINEQFDILATVLGNGNSASGWSYEQLIENLDPATQYFFRVKTTNNNQEIYYSNIIKLITPPLPQTPVEDFDVHVQSLVQDDLHFSLMLPTRLKVGVTLVNSSGAMIYTTTDTYDGGTHDIIIPESAIPQNGMYFMEVSTAADKISKKVVVQ